MNFYNPYYMMYPNVRPSLFRIFRNNFRGINFGSILNGTQKTLNIVNQAIPLVKQVTPVMRNAKTMFRVMNEFKKIDTPKKSNNNYKDNNQYNNDSFNEYEDGPRFFV